MVYAEITLKNTTNSMTLIFLMPSVLQLKNTITRTQALKVDLRLVLGYLNHNRGTQREQI